MRSQKINGNTLRTYRIVTALFQVDNKDKKSHYFEEPLLLPDISIDSVIEIFSLLKVMLKLISIIES